MARTKEKVAAIALEFKKFDAKVASNLEEAVREGAEMVAATAKKLFTPGKHTEPHPGTPPHSVTGKYKNAITAKIQKEKGVIRGVVGAPIEDPPYPTFLEFGWSACPAGYPLLAPALEMNRGKINELIDKAVADA